MILFFYGEETYQSSHSVQQLKKAFLAKNATGGGLIVFDCNDECNIAQITQSLGEQNLFSPKKLIIIQNIFAQTKAPEQKMLIEKLKNNTEDVIVFFEEKSVRANAVLFKWLKKNAEKVQENKPLEGYALEKWIANIVKENDAKIDSDAIKELILFVGNDLWQLSQEIQKLMCYAGESEITLQCVRDIVHGRVDADMFQAIEAVATENKSIALTLLKKQIAAGDSVFHIFSMYTYQVRTLVNVSGMMRSGVYDNGVIAQTLKLHPFVVQKTVSMSQKLSYEKIISMHKKLTMLDYDIKQGNRDMDSALELFIVNA
ncbi:MAG: DNA polymerase III subunit delta [Patescibacteria group bacterium]|nr:DNA polymerase III subunit delta [Patescibacteria group bacterium]